MKYTGERTKLLPNYAWRCRLNNSTLWIVEEGQQPNTFHRFMQRLCLGAKWEKISELKNE